MDFTGGLGNRLWGMAITLYFIAVTGPYSLFIRMWAALILIYFFVFGTSRFTKGYKRII